MADYPSIANDPETSSLIVSMRAAGATQQVIADKLGVSQSRVSAALALPQLKERLELAHQALVNSCLDHAVDNMSYLVHNYRAKTPVTDADGNVKMEPVLSGQEREHAYKASVKVLETVGLAPTHTPSVIVNATLNAVNVNVSPIVQSVLNQLGARLAGDTDVEAIDADYAEVDTHIGVIDDPDRG